MRVFNTVGIFSVLLLCADVTRAKTRDQKILVLGAGMSGVSAAERLKELGYHNFEIIEGSERVGGRLYHLTMGNFTLEMGPMVVHAAPSNPVLKLLNRYNVSIQMTDYDDWTVRDRNGTDITDEADVVYEQRWEPAVAALKSITDPSIIEHRDDFTLASAFLKAGWKPTSFLDDAIEYSEIDWLYGYGPEETSAKYALFADVSEMTDEYGEYFVKDNQGYVVIAQKLLDEVIGNDTDKLKLNKVITNIEEKDGQVVITTETEEEYTADFVIVTFSLGVLQGDLVKFKPDLPEWKTDAIQQFQMAQYTTIHIQFNTTFWDNNEWIVYTGDSDGFNLILNVNKLYPGSNILSLEASNKNAVRIERLTEDEIKEEVINKLQDIYSSSNVTVPTPVDFKVSRYSRHRLFRGTWSSWPPGYSRESHYALQAPVGRVYFAGEHTNYPFYGYLHGAYLSGQEVVDKIDKCIQLGVCQNYVPPYAARGCRYTAANNYDNRAKQDDGTCQFPCVSASQTYTVSPFVFFLVFGFITVH